MALSSLILRKLRQFNSGHSPTNIKELQVFSWFLQLLWSLCACHFANIAGLFYDYFLQIELLSIGLTLWSLLCTHCIPHYASHTVLTLPDFTKPFCIEMDACLILLYAVAYLHSSMHIFTNPLPSSASTFTSSEQKL